MSQDTTAYEQDILQRLGTLCPRVYVSQVPDGVETKYPHIIVRWLEPVRATVGRHLWSSIDDAQRAGVIIRVVSRTDEDANRLKNEIKLAFLRFFPPDCDEIKLEGGQAFSTAAATPRPTTYSRELYYSFMTNLSANGTV